MGGDSDDESRPTISAAQLRASAVLRGPRRGEKPRFEDTEEYDPSMDIEPCSCRIDKCVTTRCMPLSEPLYERNFTELAWNATDEANWVNCPCRVETVKWLSVDVVLGGAVWGAAGYPP